MNTFVCFLIVISVTVSVVHSDETDYSVVNGDGSFSFG